MRSDVAQTRSGDLPDSYLRALTASIVDACLLEGLSRHDAEDLAQDIWGWILESENLELATLAPWLSAVIRNFVRRFLRRRWRESSLFTPTALETVIPERSQSVTEAPTAEARLFLGNLASRATSADRKLLELMASGYRLSEAARLTGIAPGSEQFHFNRIRGLARRIGRTTRGPAVGGSSSLRSSG